MNLRAFGVALMCVLSLLGASAHAALVSAGTPFSAPLPPTVSSLPADAFLVPIEATGAAGLQTWQFDLFFDPAVVQVVDPFDGSSGIYGALFNPADAASTSFILGGFPFNALGLVDDVSGSYPFLLDGVTGNGVLAYVVFAFLPGQQAGDPGFRADATPDGTVPEPSSGLLVGVAFAGLLVARRRSHRRCERCLRLPHPGGDTNRA